MERQWWTLCMSELLIRSENIGWLHREQERGSVFHKWIQAVDWTTGLSHVLTWTFTMSWLVYFQVQIAQKNPCPTGTLELWSPYWLHELTQYQLAHWYLSITWHGTSKELSCLVNTSFNFSSHTLSSTSMSDTEPHSVSMSSISVFACVQQAVSLY